VKRVIVCADDFGLTVEVNKAVEAACRDGVLTCASLMVGEDAVADAVAVAKRLPGLGVGLHVVLVDGKPVLPPALIPDLVDAQGRFPTDQLSAGLRFFFKPGVRAQLAAEITAQFEAFKATGLTLDHVNAHKHMHLHPTVAKLIIAIGKRYGMRAMRVPSEPPFPVTQAEPANYGLGAKAMYWWSRVLRGQIRRAWLASNDHLFGLAWTGQLSEARLNKLIPHLPPGVSEIYSHPATSRDLTLTQLMPDYHHEAEFAALVSQKLRQLIAKSGIELTTYAGLTAAQ
jgi:hopanoid biosynthesis associated protein HpnK